MILLRRRLIAQALLGLLVSPVLSNAAVLLRRDRRGRLIVPVFINERGPFQFAIDTGTSLTVISRQLAADLRLKAPATAAVLMQGSTEDKLSSLVEIAKLETDWISLGAWQLGLLGVDELDGVDGLLGADCLTGRQVDLHVRSGTAVLAESVERPLAGGASRLGVIRRFETLLAVRVAFGSTATVAILDTGAQRSVGNRPLQAALRLRPGDGIDRGAVVTGIAGGFTNADIIASPPLRLGAVQLKPGDVLFADLPIFERWDFARRPALLLGMDLLGQLGRVLVDYRRTRVLVWP